MKKFFIETWGCQMNEEDSERLSGILKKLDYEKTENKNFADLIIFNTCCVRENAELKVYGHLGILKKLKEKKSDLIIAVCGCMMQQKGVSEKIAKKYPFVDIIFGTHNIYKFPEYLDRANKSNKTVIEIYDDDKEIYEGLPLDRKSGVKAFVTIMYGCNNFCTYCVVPYVRGREKSREPLNIENEIKELIKNGYTEIMLLGQNVNSYGKDLEPKINFAQLIERVNKIPGLCRIRFMTSHPKDISDELIDAMSKSENVCEQIHLPIQSGSTSILKKMNRNYTAEQYIEIVNKFRKTIPDISITTDIIVGFPGETEDDFSKTLELIRKVEFDSAYTFIYSKREGTPAYDMENQVPDDVKHERFVRLTNLMNEISLKKNKLYEDKICEILVEAISKNDKQKLCGKTRSGKTVNFAGNNCDIGKLVNVHITKANSFSLIGEKID